MKYSKIKFIKDDKNIKTTKYINAMSHDMQTRYLCFLEGLDFISEELDDKELNIYEDKKIMSKMNKGLNRYIKERFFAMKSDLCTVKAVGEW